MKMSRIRRLMPRLVLLFLLPVSVIAQPSTRKISVPDTRLELEVPDQLQPISDELWHRKSPGRPKNAIALHTADEEINLYADKTPQSLKDDEMAGYSLFVYKDIQK